MWSAARSISTDNIRGGIFPADAAFVPVCLAYFLCLAGLAKAAIMPLHNWLPSAMVAPTPVSGLLHAVAVVKAGVFSICRIILSVFGIDLMSRFGLGLITAYIAVFTILVASLIALTKNDLKARLAYSTVSQLSYIVLGVALLTPAAVAGGLMHIAFHAFSKITLFFSAGAIFVASSIRTIDRLPGLGRRMPWTFAAFGLASLSMIGVPPASGFVSKWYLLIGSLNREQTILLAALLLSMILNAAYFGPIVFRGFFAAPHPDVPIDSYREAPLFMVIPLFITALISVILGFYPQAVSMFVRVLGGYG